MIVFLQANYEEETEFMDAIKKGDISKLNEIFNNMYVNINHIQRLVSHIPKRLNFFPLVILNYTVQTDTPLLLAIKNGHKEIVELLIEKGADIEHKTTVSEVLF